MTACVVKSRGGKKIVSFLVKQRDKVRRKAAGSAGVSLPPCFSGRNLYSVRLRPAVLLPAPGFISSLATYSAEYWMCFRSFSLSSWSCLGLWPGRGRERAAPTAGSAPACSWAWELWEEPRGATAPFTHFPWKLILLLSLSEMRENLSQTDQNSPASSIILFPSSSVNIQNVCSCVVGKKVLEGGVDKGTLGRT